MLAKPMAREPPARERSPRRPRKSMEMMEREYSKRPVRTIGSEISAMHFASLRATYKWVLCGFSDSCSVIDGSFGIKRANMFSSLLSQKVEVDDDDDAEEDDDLHIVSRQSDSRERR